MESLKAAAKDYTSIFYVPQMAAIRSKWLRVPELMVTVMLFVAFVAYSYLYKLGFMTKLQPHTMAWIAPSEVQTNFATCMRAFGNCTVVEPDLAAYPHCAQSGNPNAKFPCKVFAQSELFNAVGTAGLTVGTFVSDLSGDADANHHYFVAAVEDLNMVRVMARAHDLLSDDSLSLKAQGYMQFQGEEQPRVIPTTVLMPGRVDAQGMLEGQKMCGRTDPSSPDGNVCISANLGDYYSVGVLLRAANVTLSDTLRITGTLITLHIYLTNLDDFWVWPVGFKPKYIVTPRVAQYADVGARPPPEFFDRMVFDLASTSTASRTQRVSGIRFTIEVETHMGRIDIITAVSNLAVASVVLSVAKRFCSSILTLIYQQIKSLRHIHTLKEVSEFHESLTEEHVKLMLEEGKDHSAIQRARLHFAPGSSCQSSDTSSKESH